MTDTERERIDAICKVAKVKDIRDLSDGFHTFNSLYYQRMILFAAIVKQNRDKAWKSFRHEDGELCFGGGWFIVGVDTPEGSYTYHYEAKYFDLFDCDILDYGKHWDGHTEKDVMRLLSLTSAEPPYRYVAKIEVNKEDIEELVAEKVEEIKEAMSGKWIPCSERPPKKPGSYICTCSDGTPYPKVTVIKFHPRTKAWELNGTRAYWKVRAWMSFPTPYQPKEDES